MIPSNHSYLNLPIWSSDIELPGWVNALGLVLELLFRKIPRGNLTGPLSISSANGRLLNRSTYCTTVSANAGY